MRRALCRASGQEPPTRGKRWKSRQTQINIDKQAKAEIQNNTDTETPQNIDNVESNESTKNTGKKIDDNLRFVTQFVDESTDIDQMIIENFTDATFEEEQLSVGKELTANLTFNDEVKCHLTSRKRQSEEKSSTENERNFGIVGLHTCGPLASSSLKIFLAKDAARYFLILFMLPSQ